MLDYQEKEATILRKKECFIALSNNLFFAYFYSLGSGVCLSIFSFYRFKNKQHTPLFPFFICEAKRQSQPKIQQMNKKLQG